MPHPRLALHSSPYAQPGSIRLRDGALAAALVAVMAFVLLVLAGCGGGGCDTGEVGPDGQCLERRTTQPVDCNREPEKCR